jgi:mono/diheme cytochrome c family protein
MLAALSTLGVLTLIGLALFVGALLLRRVPTGGLVIGAIIVGFGLGIPALVIDDNRTTPAGGGGGGESASGGGETTASSESSGNETTTKSSGGGAAAEGKLIFTQSCGTCHTLKDAGTNGQIGPVLDQLKPDKKRVLAAIKNGGTGSGTMPANIVTGKEAQDVADYVSSVAGK